MNIKNWSIYSGIQARGDNEEDDPWFGFTYGSFIPHFRWNKKLPWQKGAFDIGWYWLCFHGAITRWNLFTDESNASR